MQSEDGNSGDIRALPDGPSPREPSPSVSALRASVPNAGGELPMDHPLVKALHKAVREKQEAREREERRHYVDPRDIRFVMGGR